MGGARDALGPGLRHRGGERVAHPDEGAGAPRPGASSVLACIAAEALAGPSWAMICPTSTSTVGSPSAIRRPIEVLRKARQIATWTAMGRRAGAPSGSAPAPTSAIARGRSPAAIAARYRGNHAVATDPSTETAGS